MAYLFAMHPTNRLRELRKKADLTQAELAELTGVSQPAISQIENDETAMTVNHMRAFARILHCTPADLLGDQDNPSRLSADEFALLEKYRAATDDQRELVHRVAEPTHGFRQQPADPTPLRKSA